MGIFDGTRPRLEVLKGDLEDAIFAADFGDLLRGLPSFVLILAAGLGAVPKLVSYRA